MKFRAYIDLHNMYYSLYPRKLDYSKLVSYINDYGEGVIRAYGHQLGNEATTFIEALTQLGVVPIFRQPTVVKDDKGNKYQSNWAVGITLDVVETCIDVDLIFLITDSGHFDLLVEWLREHGKKVIVIGNTPSRALRMSADVTHIIPKSMWL